MSTHAIRSSAAQLHIRNPLEFLGNQDQHRLQTHRNQETVSKLVIDAHFPSSDTQRKTRYTISSVWSSLMSNTSHPHSPTGLFSSSNSSPRNDNSSELSDRRRHPLRPLPSLLPLTLAGYDYVVVDMEHGPGGIPEALACLRALDAARTPAVLRLPETSPVWAKKALYLGPAGLMLPAVESPAAAAAAVSHCRYPPRGVRGAAHPIVRASAYGLDDSYLSRCEDDTLIVCQVETAGGIAEVDAVAVVDGVDVVQMDPLDLSASMGYLWDPGKRKVRATLREAEMKVLEARKKKVAASDGNAAYLGGFAMSNDPPEQLKMRGYRMVPGAVDIGLFRKAALDDVKRFREAMMEIGEEGDAEEEEKEEKETDWYWSE